MEPILRVADRSMVSFMWRLRRIGADEVWQSLSSEWPILILSDIEIGKPGFRDAVVELLKRHSIEWQNFSRLVEHQRLPYAA
jgi:hypothetical protein